MTRLKFLASLAFLLILSGALYYGLVLSKRPLTPDKAYDALLKGDLTTARRALCALPPHRLVAPLNLYLGYLEQAEGHFDQANTYFNSVLASSVVQTQGVRVQSYLALALGAYQMHREEEAWQFLQKAKQEKGPLHPALLFFEAFNHYINHDFVSASHLWATYDMTKPISNDWMMTVLYQWYPPSWTRILLAHCLIERGDIKTARTYLEKEQHQIDNPDLSIYQLATLFSGLSYLKEASTLPLAERASYYQLAHFYLKKTTQLNPNCREKEHVMHHVTQELMNLLGTSLSELTQPWCLAFLHLLQDWQSTSSIEMLTNIIAQHLIYETFDNQKRIFTLLKEEFQGTPLYHTLRDSFVTHFEEAIYHNSVPSFYPLWQTLSEFCTLADVRIQNLAHGIHSHLLKTLYWDDVQLSNTQRLAELYLAILPQNHDLLASDLLQKAFQLWGHTGQEEKGQVLMDFVLTISHHKPIVKQQIEVFLKDLFVTAEANNLLSRLTLIHDALTHFQITVNQAAFTNHAKIVNHLADAAYLYEARNYLAAQAHAVWVLKLDPGNICAQRLSGLTCFQLGHYEQAIDLLEKLAMPDLYVQQALAFAKAYTTQQQTEHIAQVNDLDSFDEED